MIFWSFLKILYFQLGVHVSWVYPANAWLHVYPFKNYKLTPFYLQRLTVILNKWWLWRWSIDLSVGISVQCLHGLCVRQKPAEVWVLHPTWPHAARFLERPMFFGAFNLNFGAVMRHIFFFFPSISFFFRASLKVLSKLIICCDQNPNFWTRCRRTLWHECGHKNVMFGHFI